MSQSLQLTRHHQPQDAASVCQLPAVVCVQGKDTYLQCQYNTAAAATTAAAAAAVAAGGWCWPLALIDYNACVCVQINVFFSIASPPLCNVEEPSLSTPLPKVFPSLEGPVAS